MVRCLCGGAFEDHEDWMSHVRRGILFPRRSPRSRIREREQDRQKLLEYIDRHSVIESDNLILQERKIA